MGKSSFLQDFKSFAMKGNVIDMAVGVIIGGAFGKIVSSVVADIIMPPLGLLVGGVNFNTWDGAVINLYAPAEGMFLPDTKDKRKRFPLHEK